jgi:hypothetical protein
MLEAARRNMNVRDTISVFDEQNSITIFMDITREDITANGKIVPVGARHFAERARRVQNLTQLWQVKAADPSVSVHLSGKEFAKILADELGEPTLYGENISITEQLETMQRQQDAEMENQEKLSMAAEIGI